MSLLNLVVKNYLFSVAKSEFITILAEKASRFLFSPNTVLLPWLHGRIHKENIPLNYKAFCKFFGSQKISHVNTKVLIFII